MKDWRNNIIPYRRDLKSRARKLRTESTKAEVLLWIQLKQLPLSVQFHRQVPMLDFIVDFYCTELKLAIELDGPNHLADDVKRYDKYRQKLLEKYGVTFLRFEDDEIFYVMDLVLERITDCVIELQSK